MRTLALAALAAALLSSPVLHAAEATRTQYLDLVNRANDSVISVNVAAAGTDTFRAVPLTNRIRGGGGATTVQLAGDTCVYDVRVGFRDGRSMIQRDVNVCRASVLRIGKLPRANDNAPVLADASVAPSTPF